MRPIIIAHRGFWGTDHRRMNTLDAFRAAWDRGWGVELDVRDYRGRLVVSHDVPTCEIRPADNWELLDFARVLDALGSRRLPLAVNVKSCGLVPLIRELVPPPDWFFFDHAVPDLLSYAFERLPYFLRMSPAENLLRDPWLVKHARGVWLDSTSPDTVPAGKRVCVVSDEVRGKNRDAQWFVLRNSPPTAPWMLCTDLPDVAEEYFA